MKLRAILSLLPLALVGAAPGWEWHLPPGVAPPPVPADNPMRAAKVELGRRLFYDADLSLDGTMACATCHEARHGFGDGNTTHPGVTGEAGRRNVPGLANVAWFSPLTHADPGQTTLERQVAVPVMGTHPVEMGMAGRADQIAQRLGRDGCYRRMFAEAFPENDGRIDLDTVAKAIAGFERTLVSYGSAWDHGALDAGAQRGERTFRRACAGCHAGVRFTDLRFHLLGPVDVSAPDQGLYEKTGRADDRGRFRTPSLRNVAMTGPWWHDGSAKSLDEAIARHGLALRPGETVDLIAFLKALDDPAFAANPATRLPDTACGKAL
ncbi:cytochrome C peroxidase [Novosphingobium sp. Fuku2-ISO-50]|nr:cytochrome C peroxidase [Novosphingobium sp. Fuku2-ISO-50]